MELKEYYYEINKSIIDLIGIKYKEHKEFNSLTGHIKRDNKNIINIEQELDFIHNFSLLELIINTVNSYKIEFIENQWCCSINEQTWHKADSINLATVLAFLNIKEAA